MTSPGILVSVRVENCRKSELHPICLKFGMGNNFEMLITKRRLKLKLENVLRKKLQLSTDFSQNYTNTLFNNSIAMVTVDVP